MNELYRRVFSSPRTSGYALLNRHADPIAELSYSDLVADARRRAREVRLLGPPGTIVGLVFADPLQFVTALFACLYVGLVPIPVAPRYLAGLVARLRKLGVHAILIEAGLSAPVLKRVPGLIVRGWPAHATRRNCTSTDGTPAPRESDEVCLIQLSSGTTGEPRPIGLTAANVCSNEQLITQHFGHGRDSRIFGWLPHTHDMGLFGTLLQPFFVNCPGFLGRPADFVREPHSWLRCISRWRVSSSGAPTFAYRICADAPGHADDLDLSSWRVAFVGAEPVRASVLRRFSRRFVPAGFRPEALMACYGLAEATLFVTGERPDQGLRTLRRGTAGSPGTGSQGTELVCVGEANPGGGVSVRLGARGDSEWPDEGEILVAGPSVAQCDGVSETGWLHTGDLGVIHEGRLYVCGRLKDVVKVRGRSVGLAEIDSCVQEAVADPGVEVCAFVLSDFRADTRAAAEKGAETVVVLVQTRIRDADLDAAPIAAVVRGRLGILATVHCVANRPRLIVRTASGKVNRTATRQRWGEFQKLHG